MDCLRGCLATLSVLVVSIALHEKAYRFIVCEFGGFQMYYVMRVSAPSPIYIGTLFPSTDGVPLILPHGMLMLISQSCAHAQI